MAVNETAAPSFTDRPLPLSPTRPWHRFCSNRCRTAASRQRQAERVRQMEALIGELAKLANETER